MQPWETAWAADRIEIIERITASGWGVENDVLRGPGGLAVDLTRCPSGWDPTAGITEDEIRVALVEPGGGNLTGPVFWPGVMAYFEVVNMTGGVDGRKLVLESRTPGYDPAVAALEVVELISDNGWFTISTHGTRNLDQSSGGLGDACIPHPLIMTGAPQSIAGIRPFTIPSELAPASEAELWIAYIAETWTEPTPPRIAALVMDNPFGHEYLTATTAAIEARLPDAELISVLHEPAAPEVDTEIAALLDSQPDVWLSMTAGNPCLLTVIAVGQADSRPPTRFTPSVCRQPAAYLEPAGEAAEGWLSLDYRAETLDQLPKLGEGTLSDIMESQFRAYGLDPSVGFYLTSWEWAWIYVELLRIATELPGGLTRPNLLLAAWSADLRPPLHHPDVSLTLNGPDDPHPIETAKLIQWNNRRQNWDSPGTISVDRNP